MRVLFLTSRFAYPPLEGDSAVCCNRIRLRSRHHEVDPLSLGSAEDRRHAAAPRQYCASVGIVARSRLGRRLATLRALLDSGTPFQVLHLRSDRFRTTLERLICGHRLHVVETFLLGVAPSGLQVGTGPLCLLDLVDSLGLTLSPRLPREPNPVRPLFLEEDLCRVILHQRSTLRRFDRRMVPRRIPLAAAPLIDSTPGGKGWTASSR